MPIYEYKCNKCKKHMEVMQKITEPPLKVCPECGGRLTKLISNTSFVLKGSGWYATDYASGKRKKAAEAEKKSPGDEKSGGDKPSEAKKSESPGDSKAET